MVGDESAQALRHTLTPQKFGTINRVESSPTDRWCVADVVQPRGSQQEVGIVNNVDGLLSTPSDALDVPPPPRHPDEVVLRQLCSPRNEVIGHTGNRNAVPNDVLLPPETAPARPSYSLSPSRARRCAAFARLSATAAP